MLDFRKEVSLDALTESKSKGPSTRRAKKWLTPLQNAPRLDDYDAPLIQLSSVEGGSNALTSEDAIMQHRSEYKPSRGLPSPGNALIREDPEVLHARVEEMKQSIAFIKDRFHALKQISMLDPQVAMEGGWTPDIVEVELVKLKEELGRERAQLKNALDAAGAINLQRARNAVAFDPNMSVSSITSQSRSQLYSDGVADKLEALCKDLSRHCKAHDRQIKIEKLGKLPGVPSRRSPSLPERLRPRNYTIKPLFNRSRRRKRR